MATTSNGQITKHKDAAGSVVGLLEKNKDQLLAALPSHIKPDRMLRTTLTTLRKTPALTQCSLPSLLGAIMQAAQLGLELDNGLGHAYLVPYKGEATLLVGYKGLLQLARRSGQISEVYAYVVHENDTFEFSLGTSVDIVHKPVMGDRGAMTHVYAVAKLSDGGKQVEVMSKADVDAIRSISRSGRSGPWLQHYEEMAKKTVLRRLCKMLPSSIEMQRAVSLDEEADANLPQSFEPLTFDIGESEQERISERIESVQWEFDPNEGEAA